MTAAMLCSLTQAINIGAAAESIHPRLPEPSVRQHSPLGDGQQETPTARPGGSQREKERERDRGRERERERGQDEASLLVQ